MLRRLAALPPYLLALLPWAWVLWPLLAGNRFYVSEGAESLKVSYPLHHVMAVSLQDGRLPLWTPLISNGFPLMAEGEAGVMYPLNLFIFKYLPPFEAYQAALALAPLLSLIGAYYYLRARRHSFLAALLGGVCFAFGGYMLGHLRHLGHLQAMSMLPVTLMFTERFLERRRLFDALLAGSAWAVAWLAGMPQVAWLIGFAVGLVVILRAAERPDPALFVGASMRGLERPAYRVGQAALFLPGMAVLAGLLAAPQLMMTWELIPFSSRAAGVPLEAVGPDSVGLAELIHLVAPHAHGIPVAGTYSLSSHYGETLGYVGLLPLVLAALSIMLIRRDRRVLFPLVLCVVAHLLALGTNTPLYPIAWEALPGLAWFGVPGRFLLLVNLGIGMLAAIGLDMLVEKLEYHPHPLGVRFGAALPLLVLGVTGVDLGYHGSALMAWMDKRQVVDEPATKRAMPGLGSYRLLSLPGGSRRAGGQAEAPSDLRTDPQPFLEARALLWHNYNIVHDVNAVGASVGMPLAAVRQLEQRLIESLEPDGQGNIAVTGPAYSLMNFLGVRLIQSFRPLTHDQLVPLEDVAVDGLATPMKQYGLEDPHPRAYVARGVRRCGPEETMSRILAGRFGYGWMPCREGAGGEEAGADESVGVAGVVKLKSRGDTFTEFEVNLLNPGYLVVRETYTPGWVSLVDSLEAETIPVDLIYRAVPVPRGSHVVRQEYRPQGMSLGLGLNLAGLILVAFGVLVVRGGNRIETSGPDEPAPGEGRWYR